MRTFQFRQTEWFKFLSSLKLAVLVILSLAAVLSYATILESQYGMRAAHVLVYGTHWFYGLLGLLGLNVLCAALSRYPWKKHQTGFVVTHSGILVILLGSLVTQQLGVDGNLPVVESASDSRVILHPLRLVIFDEARKTEQAFPIAETALRSQGELLTVQFGSRALVVKEFLPRVRPIRKLKASPVPGMGIAGVELVLSSSRFGEVDQTLLATKPDGWTDVNLGPARIAFKHFRTAAEEKRFLTGAADAVPRFEDPQSRGDLVVSYNNQEVRVPILGQTHRWKRLGSTSLEVLVESYLPYATVQDNKLVSKSNDPINPAVQIRLRNPLGVEEKHTAFANFPEFETLHNRRKIQRDKRLGARVRFIASERRPGVQLSGTGQGILALAQSADGKRLYYRSQGAAGDVKARGELKEGATVPIGWMDTELRVQRWFPSAVQVDEPVYVEKTVGTNGNFLSAIRVEALGSGLDLIGENWMIEGETRSLTENGRRYLLRFDREQLPLPFEIFLSKFTIDFDPGTEKAAGYKSEVEVRTPAGEKHSSAVISMNEPLHHSGYTFYQASYQLRENAEPISVFSVNYDPGRWIKYLGSILLCLGICLMFYMNPHYWGILLGKKKKG
jgi:hypothetical protein